MMKKVKKGAFYAVMALMIVMFIAPLFLTGQY